MKVSLIEFSGFGWPDPADRAATVLIFTKQTRLTMNPGLMEEISAWSKEKKMAELSYMANTIPSSHEFCDYIFLIEGVTRAYTHQQVRTRQASYAQQTLRVLDISDGPGWDYLAGPSIANDPERLARYEKGMKSIAEDYKWQIAHGAKIEDARGQLPTNVLTNIVMKLNMRNFVELVRKRSSPRTQSEYRDVLDAMKAAVREVHPWIDLFIERDMDKAIADLQKLISDLNGKTVLNEDITTATKLLDQIRAQS